MTQIEKIAQEVEARMGELGKEIVRDIVEYENEMEGEVKSLRQLTAATVVLIERVARIQSALEQTLKGVLEEYDAK